MAWGAIGTRQSIPLRRNSAALSCFHACSHIRVSTLAPSQVSRLRLCPECSRPVKKSIALLYIDRRGNKGKKIECLVKKQPASPPFPNPVQHNTVQSSRSSRLVNHTPLASPSTSRLLFSVFFFVCLVFHKGMLIIRELSVWKGKNKTSKERHDVLFCPRSPFPAVLPSTQRKTQPNLSVAE